MEESRFTTFISKNWSQVLIILLFLFGVYTASQYSFIQVSVEGSQSSQEIIYKFTDTKKNKSTDHATQSASYKKLVRKGQYEVLVSQGNRSSMSVVNSGYAFSTKQINMILSPDKGRSFVGNNPFPCVMMSQQILLSYQCGDFLSKTVAHMPANDKLPTYIAKATYPVEGKVAGTYYKDGKAYAFVHNDRGGDSGTAYILYELNGQRILSKREFYDVSGISNKLKPYKNGFILYDNSFSSFRYYNSPNGSGEDLNLVRSEIKNKDIRATLIATRGDVIATVFDNSEKLDDEDVHRDSASGETIITVYKNNQPRTYKFSYIFSSLELCGENKLCGVSDKTLFVYDTKGSKAKLLYRLPDVESVTQVGDQLILQRSKSIVAFDPDNQSGVADYILGDYTSCGVPQAISPNEYVLCLINNRQKKVAMLIDREGESDNIDWQVSELQKLSSVDDVSSYGNYLYVTPRLGPPIRDKASGLYISDPAVVRVVTDEINKKVAELGINTQKYKVINLSSR